MSQAFPTAIRASWDRQDRHRLLSVIGAVGLVAALAMAAFGLPSVDLHGPLHKVGVMDPLCGGTRAAYFTTQGDWGEAWRYNPLGIITVLAAGLAVARLVVGWFSRRWINVSVQWTPRARRVVLFVAVVLVVALEVRQQLRADLLMEGTFTFV